MCKLLNEKEIVSNKEVLLSSLGRLAFSFIRLELKACENFMLFVHLVS